MFLPLYFQMRNRSFPALENDIWILSCQVLALIYKTFRKFSDLRDESLLKASCSLLLKQVCFKF